jgi:two-component system, NtrC family, response regulator AtoC
MPEIAIIDDEKVLLKSLQIGLQKSGYHVVTFPSAKEFADYLQKNEPDVVFLDLQLPDGYGLDILEIITAINPDIPTIIITAHGDIPSAVRAMKLGAFDYISKPFDLDVVEMLIVKACKKRKLVQEVQHHRNRSHRKTTLKNIIGQSHPMQELFQKVRRIGEAHATTVLILGESGTGKNLLAKAIHNLSSRKEQQFIEVNCATLPEALLESELFGHERGAFTDAKSSKIGLAELADGGTLFLDEIGELPLSLQAKLLKFIETRSFRKIGGTKEIQVDILILGSTNRDLEQCVAEKTFRQDLYYRMSVVPLKMPPLRNRKGDVELLISHYWQLFTQQFHKSELQLNKDLREVMAGYEWPGNIRELRNLLEQLVILSGKQGVQLEDLPLKIRSRISIPATSLPQEQQVAEKQAETEIQPLYDAIDALEIKSIDQAMIECGGVKSKAAEKLGISRFTLLRKLKRFGMYQ